MCKEDIYHPRPVTLNLYLLRCQKMLFQMYKQINFLLPLIGSWFKYLFEMVSPTVNITPMRIILRTFIRNGQSDGVYHSNENNVSTCTSYKVQRLYSICPACWELVFGNDNDMHCRKTFTHVKGKDMCMPLGLVEPGTFLLIYKWMKNRWLTSTCF